MKKICFSFVSFWLAVASPSFSQPTVDAPLKTLQRKGSSVVALAFSEDSKRLAVGGADGKIVLWDIESGLEEKTFTGHGGMITFLQFTSDGGQLISASKDKTIRLYETSTGMVINVFSGHTGTVTKAWLNEKTNQLISVSADRCIKIWDKNSGKLTTQFPAQPKELSGFWQSTDGKYLYISSADFLVKQFDLSSGKYVREIAKHSSIIRSMEASYDGGFFVMSGDDPAINIVNTNSGLTYKTLTGHKSFVPVFSLSGDDRFIVSGSADKTIKVWNIEKGAEALTFPKQGEIITAVAFSPDGKKVASSDLSDKVKIWDVSLLGIGENLHSQKGFGATTVASIPSDKSREESNSLTKKSQNTSSSKTENLDFDPAKTVNKGNYYALIIAVQDYIDPTINDLDKPANDAQKMLATLQNYYTFEKENTTFLKNPTRDDIVKVFDVLSKKVTEYDNLLIFYAGHGVWDEQFKKGYWLPADAEKDNRAHWFSNSDLKDYIGGIKSKHTLLIADACFSGGIFKTRDAFANASRSIKQFYELPSRKAMTSGALKTVPDESVFIRYMIKRLEENQDPFFASETLFSSFRQAVINNSPNGQVPQYGEIKETGDEGGDFIFIKRKK